MPAILRRFFASEAKLRSTQKSTKKRICIFSVDLIALFIQCGYIPLVLMTGHFNEQSEQISSKERIVEYACAIVLISFSWWENFADNRLFCTLTAKNHWYKFIMSIKFDLQESRPIVSVFMSLWKIGLTCLMCWALGSDEDADMLEYFNMAFDQLSNQPFAKQSAIVTLTLTAFVGHYVGYTACKLRLQSISYNIPLVLSTPLAVLIVSLHCQYGNILTVFTEEQLEHGCTDLDLELDWWHYLAGLAVLWSLYWIGRHIFFPNIERLAKTER